MPEAGATPRRLDLLVAGHVNLDHFLHADQLPTLERTVPLTGRETALGGTAGTIARAAARAGVRVGLISRVGPDLPREYSQRLEHEGIDLTGVEVVKGALTPACYIFEDGRGHQMTAIDQGPMGDPRGATIPTELLRSASWLHLTTGMPQYQLRLKSAARRLGLRVAVDPAQELHYLWKCAPLEELLSGAEILFGNVAEFARIRALLGVRSDEALLDRVPLLVRTEGARGACAISRTGTVRVASVRVRGKAKVTGAGDAFRGGFYGAFFRGSELPAALEAGCRAAADWMRRG
jgi:nucleoside kinase